MGGTGVVTWHYIMSGAVCMVGHLLEEGKCLQEMEHIINATRGSERLGGRKFSLFHVTVLCKTVVMLSAVMGGSSQVI